MELLNHPPYSSDLTNALKNASLHFESIDCLILWLHATQKKERCNLKICSNELQHELLEAKRFSPIIKEVYGTAL